MPELSLPSPTPADEEIETAADSAPLDLGPLTQFPGYVFRRAQARITAGVTRLLEPFDLRLTAFSVLLVLKYNPGIAHSVVADALNVARTNFVALIESLRKRGLVAVHARADDRRFRALYLSRDGLKLVNMLEPLVAEHEIRIRAELEENRPGIVAEVCGWLARPSSRLPGGAN